MKIPLIGPHGLGRFPQRNARRCVNMYVALEDAGGKAKLSWVKRPGLKLFCATTGVVRGWVRHGSYVYFVAADKLYRVDSAGTVSSALGTLTTDSSASYPHVSMAATLYEVVVADGTREMFVYNTQSGAFTTVTSYSIESLVDTITRSAGSKTATVTCLSDHLANTGDSVLVSFATFAPNTTDYYNGTFTITRTGATTFTYAITGKACALSGTAGTVTVTTTTPHQLNTGDAVDIVDATTAGYNANSVTVTKTAETTFTYANATTGAATGIILPPQPDPVTTGIATVQARTDALTFQPAIIASMDGYVVAENQRTSTTDGVNRQQFYVSDGDDATTWDPTMMGAAQRSADDLIAPFASGGNLYLLGEYSTEVHYNGGGGDMPFLPTREAASSWGCVAPHSVRPLGDGIAWLGQHDNGQVTVLKLEGYRPKPIASEMIEYRLSLATSTQVAAATAFSFRWQGHEFYGLTVASETWVYDDTVSEKIGPTWYSWSTSSGPFRGRFHIYAFGKHLFTDSTYGQILELDTTTYTDLNNATAASIQSLGVSGYIHSEDKPVSHNRVQVDLAASSGSGTLLLESTDDAGTTWTSHGSQSFGTSDARLEWHGLGQARTDRAYRLTTSDNVSVCILDAYADVGEDAN